MMQEEHWQRIEQDLALIKERNARVEADKAWEGSRTRIASICVITYLVAGCLLWALGAKRFWLDALVPVLGFFLSSRSLRWLKAWWIECRYGK